MWRLDASSNLTITSSKSLASQEPVYSSLIPSIEPISGLKNWFLSTPIMEMIWNNVKKFQGWRLMKKRNWKTNSGRVTIKVTFKRQKYLPRKLILTLTSGTKLNISRIKNFQGHWRSKERSLRMNQMMIHRLLMKNLQMTIKEMSLTSLL